MANECRGRTAFPPRRSTRTTSISPPSAWKMGVYPFFSMIRRNRVSRWWQAGRMASLPAMPHRGLYQEIRAVHLGEFQGVANAVKVNKQGNIYAAGTTSFGGK